MQLLPNVPHTAAKTTCKVSLTSGMSRIIKETATNIIDLVFHLQGLCKLQPSQDENVLVICCWAPLLTRPPAVIPRRRRFSHADGEDPQLGLIFPR